MVTWGDLHCYASNTVLRAVLSSIWFARTVHKHVGNRGIKAVSELLH